MGVLYFWGLGRRVFENRCDAPDSALLAIPRPVASLKGGFSKAGFELWILEISERKKKGGRIVGSARRIFSPVMVMAYGGVVVLWPVVLPDEPAPVAWVALPLGLPPWMPPVFPAELLGPGGTPVLGLLVLGLVVPLGFVPFESLPLPVLLGLTVAAPLFVELGVVLPLLSVEPDVDPLLVESEVDPLEFDDAPLLIEELLSVELEDPLLSEEPVESPDVLVPAAPETLVPAPLEAPADPPLVPPAPAPPPAPPLPPPPAARR
jgi:hypothetical protein